MDAKLKAKWIDALKGEYADKKGKENLCYKGLLGVIAEISGDLVLRDNQPATTRQKNNTDTLWDGMYGLTFDDKQDLITINDENDTFALVIDYIERNL